MARALGSRGGRARGKRLSAAERKRIASLGGQARLRHSRHPAALPTISDMPSRWPASRAAGHRPASARVHGHAARDLSRPNREMADPADHLQTVGDIVQGLRALGLEPVLVGGMALVVLGSRRVTRDFDFVIAHPGDRLAGLIDLLYDHGLELVSRLNKMGEVISTIANRKVAASPASSRCAGKRVFLQHGDKPSRRPPVRLPHPCRKARRACDANQDSLASVRHRFGAGSPAPQEDRQSGAFVAGRCRGHRLSRVTPEELPLKKLA